MNQESIPQAITFESPELEKRPPPSVSNVDRDENIGKEIWNLASSQSVTNTAKKRALSSLQDGKVPEYIKTTALGREMLKIVQDNTPFTTVLMAKVRDFCFNFNQEDGIKIVQNDGGLSLKYAKLLVSKLSDLARFNAKATVLAIKKHASRMDKIEEDFKKLEDRISTLETMLNAGQKNANTKSKDEELNLMDWSIEKIGILQSTFKKIKYFLFIYVLFFCG